MYQKALVVGTVLAAASLGATVPSSLAYATTPSPTAATAVATHQLCAATSGPGQNTCFAVARTHPVQPAATPGDVRPFTLPAGYGPADLQSAYNLQTASASAGGNQLVAVVDAYGAPNLASDLATYRTEYGLPACTTGNGCFHILNQNGQSSPLPAGDVGWAGETSLDVEMVSAICPKCSIDVIEANSNGNDLYTAVNTAVSLNAKFVSLSWGAGESSSETSLDSYFNHPGVAITASSGDGSYGVSYPAASPYVVAVGGTSLSRASNARGWTETAWSGAGSGCSAYEFKPGFQHDSGCSRRTVADVAAVADPYTGVAYYDSYGSSGWGIAGGTSVASPIIASVYALAGVPVTSAYANSYPYRNPGFVWDTVGGSNGSCGSYLCTGVLGYDGPTGLGTPNGVSSFWAPGTTGGKAGYTDCAGENGACTATARVAFGVSGQFNYQSSTNLINCNNQTFGDPVVNQVKACYDLPLAGSGAPAGYTLCAAENGTCSFSGTASVAFGANGQFNYRSATGSIGCNYGTFGDPAPGVLKSCYYQSMTSSGGPAGYTLCAAENGTCSFSGTATVAFGVNGQYSYRLAAGSISCNTITLGDPAVGSGKNCYYN